MKFYISLACNDPRNGNPTGYVDAIQVRPAGDIESLMQLVGGRLSLRMFYSANSKKPREIKIGHIILRIHSYSTWVGNWCWDEASADTDQVERLLAYLQRRGWTCEQGESTLYEKWERKEIITAADLDERAAGEGEAS